MSPRYQSGNRSAAAGVRALAVSQRSRGCFQQITHRRMPILSHERYGAVVENGQDHGAAVMMDHFALVGPFAFAHSVDGDVEDAAVKNLLAVDYFWQFHVSILQLDRATR